MAMISGCYRWNDTLAPSESEVIFEGTLAVNGVLYPAAIFTSLDDGSVMAGLFDEADGIFIVYISETGWIRALNTDEENPVFAQSDLWQTWNFGTEEQEVSEDFYDYLLANATMVASEEAVNVSYDGKIIASVESGQRAKLHCEGKSMMSDLVVHVPPKKQSEGAALNIAFGNTAPDDTSKLWIKTAEPKETVLGQNVDFVGNGGINSGIAALPTRTTGHNIAAAVGKKIYLFGGVTYPLDNTTAMDIIQVYDIETNTAECLEAKIPLEGGFCHTAAMAYGTKIYLFGGVTYNSLDNVYLNTVYRFDTEDHSFTQLSCTFSYNCAYMACASVGKKIYLFGGRDSDITSMNTVFEFDAEYETLMKMDGLTLSERCFDSVAVTVGTKIYLFGGRKKGSSKWTYYNNIWIFDTEARTVAPSATVLPTNVFSMAAAAYGTKIYLFGGRQQSPEDSTSTEVIKRILVFDTETQELTEFSEILPSNLAGAPFETVGNKTYLLGGYYGATTVNTVHTFTDQIALPENHVYIELGGEKNFFHLLPNLEVGVNNVYLGDLLGRGKKVAAALYKDGAWVEI